MSDERRDRLAYQIPEASHVVGVGRSKIYEEIADGRLRAVKAGRRTLIMRCDLEEWLNQLPHINDVSRNNKTTKLPQRQGRKAIPKATTEPKQITATKELIE